MIMTPEKYWDTEFKDAYKEYIRKKYHLDEWTRAPENPRAIIIKLIQFESGFVSDEKGSANEFKHHLLNSVLSDGVGIIMGFDADTWRRSYDAIKNNNFAEGHQYIDNQWKALCESYHEKAFIREIEGLLA